MFQEFIEILILSAVQGISEFLPISSSSHLILISSLYDFKTSSLLIDISLHLGSLFAIIFYFRNDLFNLRHNRKLLSLIIIGSIPLIIFGYILHHTELIYLLRNLKVIAWTTLFFGVILFFADQRKIDQNISTNLNIKNILNEIDSILYAGILSGGLAFVLQIYAQKNITPAPAAIIFSLEGVFATIAAWFLLNQVLGVNNLLGCFFILSGVLLSQLLPLTKRLN